MGLWVAGSSPLTVGGNCVNMVKPKTKKTTTTTTTKSLMTTTIRVREQEKGSAESWLALGGRHEIGTQLFHFASVLVFVCGRVSNIIVCVRVSMFFCACVCACLCALKIVRQASAVAVAPASGATATVLAG